MDMEKFNSIDPVIWIIVAAAGSICIFVLLNKAIKKLLKLIVIGLSNYSITMPYCPDTSC